VNDGIDIALSPGSATLLEEWCQPHPDHHLYYPSRRKTSAAFGLLVQAVRYRP
jgi:hypothetical protein